MSETTHQRRMSSSIESLMSQLQQSQMTIVREQRARIMNLIDEEEMKSKIFNFVMSTLNELITSKNKNSQESELYRFRKSIEFSTKRRSQRRDLSVDDQIIVNE